MRENTSGEPSPDREALPSSFKGCEPLTASFLLPQSLQCYLQLSSQRIGDGNPGTLEPCTDGYNILMLLLEQRNDLSTFLQMHFC